MRTTLTLDDLLLEQAQEFVGPLDKSALVNLALRRLVEWEASRRLARMGGSDPTATAAPRRRWAPDRDLVAE